MTRRHPVPLGWATAAGWLGCMLCLALPGSAGAATGAVAVEPASGSTDSGNIRLVTSDACPDGATNVIVQVAGAAFPEGSNAVGNTEIAAFEPPVGHAGLVIPLFGSWDVVAQANGASGAPDGIATLTLSCIDAARTYAEMKGEVRFDAGAARYEQVGGPALASGFADTVAPAGTEAYAETPPDSATVTQDVADTDQREAQTEPGVDGIVPDATADDGQPVPDGFSTDPSLEGDGASGTGDPAGTLPWASQGDDATDNVAAQRGETGNSRTPLLIGAGIVLAGLAAGITAARRPAARPPT